MAKVEFSYSRIRIAPSEASPKGRIARRPLAEAKVTASNGRTARLRTLLDSGADSCVLPLSLATALGLDVPRLPKALTGGVGSQSNVTYYDNLTIDLGSGIVFNAYVGFTQGMDAIGLGLLGQDGFFDRYNVEFRNAEGIFTVESVETFA